MGVKLSLYIYAKTYLNYDDFTFLYNFGMITSSANEKIKNAIKLLDKKFRDLNGLFIVEGLHLVQEAQQENLVQEIFSADESIRGTLVSRDIIKRLSTTETPQPVVAIVNKPQVSKELGNKVLVLDNVQDPGNVGTLLRTAVAFGYTSVIVKGADVFSPKVVRASQGAIFKINIIQLKSIEKEIFNNGIVIGAMVDENAKNYLEIPNSNDKPLFLVLGNEGNGISQEVQNMLNERVYIPIKFESLNVSAAGAILMSHFHNLKL